MLEYIVVFIILLAFEIAYIHFAKKLDIVDRPHLQSSHLGAIIRGGGVIFYIAYALWFVMHGMRWGSGLLGLTLLAGVSFVDDIRSISPKVRLFFQFVAIFFIMERSGILHNTAHVIFILVVACVGAVNIYNFMDGINGMTGGYSLVVSCALLYVNEYMVHFAPSSLITYVILSIIVFNIFNFRQKAKCFAGDVGALSIGFVIVFFVLNLALRGHSMSWIAMLVVYGVDGGMTILHRILLRENLMMPHKKHAYQILVNELKMPHLMVSGIYMGLQAICSIIYIIYPGYTTFFIEAVVLISMYILFMSKFYHLHLEKL